MLGRGKNKGSGELMKGKYAFTNKWFKSMAKETWDILFSSYRPAKILEIGSYEGASICYLIKKLAGHTDLEIHCVDPWADGIRKEDMESVEARFWHNTRLAIEKSPHKVDLIVHKGFSDEYLPRLLSEGNKNYFDFIYIDGSHRASDVLFDAVLAFKLLKVGGIMVFDDYLWGTKSLEGNKFFNIPKAAIDAFVNIHFTKLIIHRYSLYQLFIEKQAE